MLKPITLGLALLGAAAIFSSGCHRAYCASPQKKSERIQKHIARKLHLDAGQKAKLAEIAGRLQPIVEKHRAFHQQLLAQGSAEFEKEALDEAWLKSKDEQANKNIQELREALRLSLKEFHAMLKPEQRAKAAQLMRKFERCYSGH